MNLLREEAEQLVKDLVAAYVPNPDIGCIVCPPFVWLSQTRDILEGSGIALGAQNCAATEKGAFTGEVSAKMLASLGVEYVIIGHSERRALFGEKGDILLQKTLQALGAGLTPIYCIGETLEERQAGRLEEVISNQLMEVPGKLEKEQAQKLILAYEPVWAIGTGVTASPEQAEEVHRFIHGWIEKNLGEACLASISILYGGSVTADNASGLFQREFIDGGLIGGASLKAPDFLKITQSW